MFKSGCGGLSPYGSTVPRLLPGAVRPQMKPKKDDKTSHRPAVPNQRTKRTPNAC